MNRDSGHAFHPDPAKPLAESILPMGGNKAVLTQLYPEGTAVFLGYLDDDTGEFIGTSGSFKSFRKCSVQEKK